MLSVDTFAMVETIFSFVIKKIKNFAGNVHTVNTREW